MVDQTNFDDSYTRNHIRLNVVPQIENPAAGETYKITFSTDMDNSFTNSEIKITVTSEAIQSNFTGDSPLTAPWPTP